MNRHVQACIGRTNSSRWSACCGPKPEGQRKERYMRITTAYLSGWLLHVIGSVAADRGVYGSAHSIHLGRDQSRVLAVALIRQRSCSYSRRGPTRAGVVVEESSLLWKRCAARVLVTLAGAGSRDGAEERVRVCTSHRQHGSFMRRAQCAELRDSIVVVARIAKLGVDRRGQLTCVGDDGDD
jgi:hypothetical protein